MAIYLRAVVENVTGTVPINANASQTADALRRYASSLGIPIEGTPQQQLEAILRHWIDDVARTSRRVQAEELRASNEAAIQQQVEAANAL